MQHRTPRLRRFASTTALATLTLATIGTGVAAADSTGATGARGPARLTAEQRRCLTDAGITKPTARPMKADIRALRTAAESCAIPLGKVMRDHVRRGLTGLTDEQRQCLADAGVTRPEGRPTLQQLKAFAAAAKSCGVSLRRPRTSVLTDAQRQCLTDAGITVPTTRPTAEQLAALKAAAESCGITAPAAAPAPVPTSAAPGSVGARRSGAVLTDAQRRCLTAAGITVPTTRPTAEQLAALKAAAESCGITLPAPAPSALPVAPDAAPSGELPSDPAELLTEAQRQCLADAGVTIPTTRPTKSELKALLAAAAACGITPERL
ncbi:MAG: hypothetical protein ACKO72_00340 [Actinomycetes bacterium]